MTSHRRSQVRRSLAAAVAIAALAAPAGHAAPIRDPGTGDTPGSALIDPKEVVEDQGTPVTTTIDEGFDWGSAAIGAGGAAAALLLSAAGASAVSRRHKRVDAPAATTQAAVDPPTHHSRGEM
jgi:hypothetical protein